MNRRALLAAIKALPLNDRGAANIPFAETTIAHWLEILPRTSPDAPLTKKQSAEALETLAHAVHQLRIASAAVSGPAFEALNATKHRRGLSWSPESAHWSFLYPGQFNGVFDKHWPELETCAREAARDLRKSQSDGRKGRPRNSSMDEFAILLAGMFHVMTDREPARGKGNGPFAKFVCAVLDAGGIKADGTYLADIGAQQWHAERSG